MMSTRELSGEPGQAPITVLELSSLHLTPSKSILQPSSLEGVLASFKYLFNEFAHWTIINRTHMFMTDGCLPSLCFTQWGEPQNQFRIAKHWNVRVVSGENKLSTALCLSYFRHHTVCDETIIKIVLRLVDDERRIGL